MKKQYIKFNKKALGAIAPIIAISAILLSKRQPGPLLLFFIGIAAGFLLCKNWE